MIWTRRSFLKLVSIAVAGAALPSSAIAGPTIALNPLFRAMIYRLDVESLGLSQFILLRGEAPIMTVSLPSNTYFTWCAHPGYEIVLGNGLRNGSSGDIELRAVYFELNGSRYVCTLDGCVPLSLDSPLISAKMLITDKED